MSSAAIGPFFLNWLGMFFIMTTVLLKLTSFLTTARKKMMLPKSLIFLYKEIYLTWLLMSLDSDLELLMLPLVISLDAPLSVEFSRPFLCIHNFFLQLSVCLYTLKALVVCLISLVWLHCLELICCDSCLIS